MPVSPELTDRIAILPGRGEGKVVVRDARIPVRHILKLMAEGETSETILELCPSLEPEDIQACLLLAHDLVPDGEDSLPPGMGKFILELPLSREEIEAKKRSLREIMARADRTREREGYTEPEVDIDVMLEQIDGGRGVFP